MARDKIFHHVGNYFKMLNAFIFEIMGKRETGKL